MYCSVYPALFVLQCSKDVVSPSLQYVQPVAVVPVGQPVPAVQAGAHQFTVPVAAVSPDQITNRDITVGSYGAPTHSFGPPQSSYNPPTSHSIPTAGYRGPKKAQAGFTSKIDTIDLYQTSFSAGQTEPSRPVRSGRLEECYCVPVTQCPADKIMGNIPQKDYSKLINPRVKNKYIPAGRSALEASGEETTTLAEEATEVNTEISRKKRQNEESEEQPAETVRDILIQEKGFNFFMFSLACPTPSLRSPVFPPLHDWPQGSWSSVRRNSSSSSRSRRRRKS